MQDTRGNIPTILVILGATGDLMARKISPALYNLHAKNKLPAMFRVIGVARRKLSDDEFRKTLSKSVKERSKGVTEAKLNSFLKHFSYHQALFQNKKAYYDLKKISNQIDDKWGICSNKLFYLAVPPQFYELIAKNLSSSGLTDPCSPEEGWTRVLIEKPFGKNYESAKKLDELLAKLFREVQIYRIDHYLAKEMIQNILSFRFSNTLFEKIWNEDSIERIDIRLLENIGVEKRGAYYDSAGALRDVGQNHLLQMLALITMDHPQNFEAEAIRRKREEILANLKPLTKKEIQTQTYRAQYSGYRKIDGVGKNSDTETYFKIGGRILGSPRWNVVPVTLESGKRLGKRLKDITVTFRHPTPCLCPPGAGHYRNEIVFSLEPKEGINIRFWSKKPGLTYDIEKRDFEFLLRKSAERVQYVEEYEKLLLDCIIGDQTLFVTTNEVKSMWRFTDPIVKGWQESLVPLRTYKADTIKPSREAEAVDEAVYTPGYVPEEPESRNIAVIGLGKMGANIARRLAGGGWNVAGFDTNAKPGSALEKENIDVKDSLESTVMDQKTPRTIWLMLPAGKPVDDTLEKLVPMLSKGDTVIDGGNSHFKDSIRRHKKLGKSGIHFIDVGVSGGPGGALHGSALMIGGDRKTFKKMEPIFASLAHRDGYRFFEGVGAGHFVKMIHNGIEYGMMQSIAEGFNILKKSSYNLNLKKITEVYNNGSVIESRLVDWLKEAFELHGENLEGVSGKVSQSGEGKWTVETAKAMKLKARIIEESLKFRMMSQKNPSYAGRILSALREQFGGHSIKN